MSRSRLEAFSDGVLAVAITLLALDLAVGGPGHGPLLHQLTSEWPRFAAYVVSFFVIGIIWVNHHSLFSSFRQVDRTLLFLNLLLLMFVVLIPFVTSTLATYLRTSGTDSHVAAVLYALVLEGMAVSFALIFWWAMTHDLIIGSRSKEDLRSDFRRFAFGSVVYVVIALVGFVSAVAVLASSAAVAAYYIVERTALSGQGFVQLEGPEDPTL